MNAPLCNFWHKLTFLRVLTVVARFSAWSLIPGGLFWLILWNFSLKFYHFFTPKQKMFTLTRKWTSDLTCRIFFVAIFFYISSFLSPLIKFVHFKNPVICDPHFLQKRCNFCWLCFDFSEKWQRFWKKWGSRNWVLKINEL